MLRHSQAEQIEMLHNIVDLLVPELQRRGRFRKAYTGRTLRENLAMILVVINSTMSIRAKHHLHQDRVARRNAVVCQLQSEARFYLFSRDLRASANIDHASRFMNTRP